MGLTITGVVIHILLLLLLSRYFFYRESPRQSMMNAIIQRTNAYSCINTTKNPNLQKRKNANLD